MLSVQVNAYKRVLKGRRAVLYLTLKIYLFYGYMDHSHNERRNPPHLPTVRIVVNSWALVLTWVSPFVHDKQVWIWVGVRTGEYIPRHISFSFFLFLHKL